MRAIDAKCDFTPNDPIFALSAPFEELEGLTCNECDKELTKKTKQCWYLSTRRYSKFCGKAYCSACLKQKRFFPGNFKKRHPICDTCTVKFFLKQLYEECNGKLKERDELLAAKSAEFREHAREYTELKTTYNHRKEEVPPLDFPPDPQRTQKTKARPP